MKPLITIYTPTYNRAHLLGRLYESLKNQLLHNFEWVIVDDGSIDNTQEVINEFISEDIIPIIYFKKENEGKHIAINKGVSLANGELFFIVDSDDYLTNHATQLIQEYYTTIKENQNIAGVSFRRGSDATTYIGSDYFADVICNIFQFRYQKKIKGDMAEVYKTNVLKKYPFPKIENEKFCAESLIWNRIGLVHQMLWTSHIIYIGEYLNDGLTAKMVEIRKKSPTYALAYYSELQKMPIPVKYRLKANINFWRFSKYSKLNMIHKIKMTNKLLSVVGLPIGFLYNLTE